MIKCILLFIARVFSLVYLLALLAEMYSDPTWREVFMLLIVTTTSLLLVVYAQHDLSQTLEENYE